MNSTVSHLSQLLTIGEHYFAKTSRQQMAAKPAPTKWSKKEILGHLIDSAIVNIRRFSEILCSEKPFLIPNYNPDALVEVNNYQGAESKNVAMLWLYLNKQIIHIMNQQNETTLQSVVILKDRKETDLRFLMNDYVEHLEHHLKQIIS